MGQLIASGAVAGVLVGVVLRRADLCFHSMFRGLFRGRLNLFATWALGVSVAAVGLSVIYEVGDWDQLNQGLPFDPVRNIAGGLIIGVGMVVALSCVSGLFYKLGAGMLGALVGLAGWFAGDVGARDVELPGERRVLDGGEEGTLPNVLSDALPGPDLPEFGVALVLLAGVVVLLLKVRPAVPKGGWRWPVAGVALGLATTAAWALAGWGDAGFGPSTVGAPSAVADGLSGDGWDGEWQMAFLLGIVGGSALWSAGPGRLWVRGEDLPRYAGLAAGGILLGVGGQIAGGCNLGHGLSGMAQMNIGSYAAVASMAAGVGIAAAVTRQLRQATTTRPKTKEDWLADTTP